MSVIRIVEFYQAMMANNYQAMLDLFRRPDFCVNAFGLRYRTPLLLAATNARPNLVRILLQMGANPNQCAANGQSPLEFAIQENDHESATALLEDARTKHVFKVNLPIHVAAEYGDQRMVDIVIDFCGMPRRVSMNGEYPSQAARRKGRVEIANYLQGIENNNLQFTLARWFQSDAARPHKAGMFQSAMDRDNKVVASMIENGIEGEGPFGNVLEEDAERVIQYHGWFGGLQEQAKSAIDENQVEDLVQLFVDGLVFEDAKWFEFSGSMGESACHKASRRGNTGLLGILLREGAILSQGNTHGRSSMELAQENGHAGVVELLEAEKLRQVTVFETYVRSIEVGHQPTAPEDEPARHPDDPHIPRL